MSGDDWNSRAPRLRAEMLALLRRPYEPHHIPRPSDADLEAFAEAFVASSRPYHERAHAQPQGELFT